MPIDPRFISCLFQPDDLVVLLGIDEDHRGGFLGLWHSVDICDFHPQDISAVGAERNGPALTDIPKEMMLRAGGDLLDL